MDPKFKEKYKKYQATIPVLPESKEVAILKTPDGKDHKIPLLEGTGGQRMLDVRNLYQQSGYFTYDPGFTMTGSCMSTITEVDPIKGELRIRGYPIEELTEKCSYIEVCYLLLYGDLPDKDELLKFEKTVVQEMPIHTKLVDFYKGFNHDAHPMAIMTGVVGALAAFMHEDLDLYDPEARELAAIRVIAKMPTLAAIAFRTASGLPIVHPKEEYSFIENFLYMMFDSPSRPWKVHERVLKATDVICILHADHEQGPSTATVRIAGSSYANPFACIAAGIASLWGPSHGGADEAALKMLREIGTPENIPKFLEKAKDHSDPFKLMGFGHRIYKSYDPRAKIMKDMCQRVVDAVGDDHQPLLDLAHKLEEAALKDEYFIKRHLFPNVDLYTGIIYACLGIPQNMFTVIFSVARSSGWMAQWCEMMSEDLIKIGRPRQIYLGPDEKKVEDNQTRKLIQGSDSRVIEIIYREDVLSSVKLA